MKIFKILSWFIAVTLLCSTNLYAKNDKQKPLPPGLKKKVESGKSLPPGWQKKVAVGQVLDVEVYEQAKIILRDNGIETVTVGGKVFRIMKNTREIIEILNDL